MKTLQHILTILTAAATAAFSAEENDHKAISGPKGGKLLETEPLHAEFFVQPDKKVSITFYDESMKPVTPEEQVLKVIAEAPSGKATLAFEKTGDGFVSTTALPEGDGYRVVVQIKPNANAKPQNFRIDYHTEICGECKHPEYACVCESHSGARHEGHAH
ncbi:MAG TPA: hypothetical protein VIS99_06135 [Terrimicrobiaceae bacterium]